jgi:hypothetical protein
LSTNARPLESWAARAKTWRARRRAAVIGSAACLVAILALGSSNAFAGTYNAWYCFDRNDKP